MCSVEVIENIIYYLKIEDVVKISKINKVFYSTASSYINTYILLTNDSRNRWTSDDSSCSLKKSKNKVELYTMDWYTNHYILSVEDVVCDNYIDVLDWWLKMSDVYKLDLKYTHESLDRASEDCNIEILLWWDYVKYKYPLFELKYTENSLNLASEYGHLDVLSMWLCMYMFHGVELKYDE